MESAVKYVILAGYFVLLLAIGWVASRRIRGMKDYFVGGKTLGYWVVAFSARATGESGWLLLGLTGMGAAVGLKAFWIVLGEVLGVSISWCFMAKRFKRETDRYDAITVPDYLVGRFGSKSHLLRIVSAIILCVFVTIYVSAQIHAIGKSFETFLDWDYFVGTLVGFLIVVVYVFSGGFLAVAWSDLFQGIMMLLGLVLLPIVAFGVIASSGREPGFWEGLEGIDASLLSVWGEGGFNLLNLMGVIGFVAIGVGFLGSPQVYVRFIAVKDENEIRKGTWVAILFTLLTDASAVLIGMTGRYLLTGPGDDVVAKLGQNAEHVLPSLAEEVMPLVIFAAYVPVVLCAIMSTVDSLLVVASSAATRDYYQKVRHPDLRDEALGQLGRRVTLVLSMLALAIALTVAVLTDRENVFWYVIFGWSGIAASFCPVILLSLFWRGFTERGAIASMLTGFLCVPLFAFGMPALPAVGHYFTALSELPPSFAIAMVVGVMVSRRQAAEA